MGMYLRKCMRIGEEGGVMEKAVEVTAARKRKAASVEAELSTSSSQLKTRRLAENSASSCCEGASASCCSSSNGSSEVTERSWKLVDLEEEINEVMTPEICGTSIIGDSLDCRKRRETTPMMTESQTAAGDELESTARPRESSYHRRSTAEKMPSETELEEFFAAAEKNLQKQFTEKYNYDFVNDQPLEGRYDWVEVQQKP